MSSCSKRDAIKISIDLIVYSTLALVFFFFFSSRRRHTRSLRDWSSDVCSSDLNGGTSGGTFPHNATIVDTLENPSPGNPTSVAAPDLDKRNGRDLVFSELNVGGKVGVLMNNGDGTRSEERRVGKSGGARGRPVG